VRKGDGEREAIYRNDFLVLFGAFSPHLQFSHATTIEFIF